MVEKLNFQCGRCGRGLTVGEEHAGKRGVCPHCRNRFTIPPARAASRHLREPARRRSSVPMLGAALVVEPAEAPVVAPGGVQPDSAAAITHGDTAGAPELSGVAAELPLTDALLAAELVRARERLAGADARQLELEARLADAESRRAETAGERDRLRRRADDLELARQEALKDYKAELLSLYDLKEALEARTRELEARVEQASSAAAERDRQLAQVRAALAELGERHERLEREDAARQAQLEVALATPAESMSQRLLQPLVELEYRLHGLFGSLRGLRKELDPGAGADTTEEYDDEAGGYGPAPEPRALPAPGGGTGGPAAGAGPGGLVEAAVFAGRERAGGEPGAGSLEVRGYRDIRSVGFDCGTSKSVMSYYKGVSIQGIFQLSRGEREGYRELVLPSTIGYLERENRFVFGYEAEDIPARTPGYRKIRSIKRCLLCDGLDSKGRCANVRNASNHDICGQGMGPWRLGRRRLETEEIIAEFIHEVFRRVERSYDVELTPEKINFTAPIYFGFVARRKLRAAIALAFARLRGPRPSPEPLEQRIKLVHEPTAAAVSQYNQFREMPDEVFAIFDMGGGTTDIAIYEKRRESLWCLAADSVQVGGDDLDDELKKLIEVKLAAWPIDRHKTEVRRVLDDFVENLTAVREALSSKAAFERVFHFPEGDFTLVIAQAELEQQILPLLTRAVDTLVKIFEDVQPILQTFEKSLAVIHLVGGATKTPAVKRLLVESFSARAPGVHVRPVARFAGLSAPDEARAILEEEFNIVSVAVGAGFPEANFREYLLDKIPFEIGVVLTRDANLDPLTVHELVPFYKAWEPVPHRCSRRLVVSQSPGNRLNLYMKREGESFYKIIRYLKFPVRVGTETRYLATDKLCDLGYEIALEITKDAITVDFDGIAQEKVPLPGAHPYYLQRDIHLEHVSRLSGATDFQARHDEHHRQVRGERTQDYLRRSVAEQDPVELAQGDDGRWVVLHKSNPIGLLRAEYGTTAPLPAGRPFIRLVREDILLPADIEGEQPISRSFRPGDPIIVFDIAFADL